MDLPEIGKRVKGVRTYLSLSQEDLAKKTGMTQIAVSRLESGKGCNIKFFIEVLRLFSNHIYIDFFFSDKFEIISKDGDFRQMDINSVIVEKLKLISDDLNKTIDYLKNEEPKGSIG